MYIVQCMCVTRGLYITSRVELCRYVLRFPMSSHLKLRKRRGVGTGGAQDLRCRCFHIDFYLFQIVLPIGGNSRWWRGESGDCATSATSPTYTAPSKLSRPLINWVLLLVLYPWNAATRATLLLLLHPDLYYADPTKLSQL